MDTFGNTEGVLDGIVHRCNNQTAPGDIDRDECDIPPN
jgi:hypothetical protein